MSSTVRSVKVLLSASTAGYIAEMKRAGAATTGVATGMKASAAEASAAQKSWAIAAKGIKFAAVGVAGGIALAGKAAADYQAEMALVKTLSHATRPEMKALDDQARHMGLSWGFTATQVAQGQEELVKAGVSLRDILHGGLKGTLALAAAGQTDVATATETAAAAMTQFKLSGKDVPHIADLLAAGADKALGSVTDLGDGLSQVGTTAHQFGFSIEETIGTLAEFAQAGLQGQRGGTVLNQMLLQLAAPTEKAQKLMDKYGLSLYDANGHIKTMSDLAGNLQHSFQHLDPAQRNYALGVIFGSRAIRGANILLKDGAKANADWTRKVNDAGFAAQQASGKLDSLKGDWQKLKAATQTALIDLGSGEQNPLRHLVQNVTGDIKRLERDGTLKRWGREIGHDIDAVIATAKPLAHDVGHALAVVGHGVKTIADGFNRLPDGVQHAIVTGGVVAYGAHKLGLDSLARVGVRAATRGGGGLAGRAGVVPVYVTNPGFGAGAGGKFGAAEGAAAGAAARGAATRGAGAVAGDAALSKLLGGGLGKLIGIGGMIPGGGGVRIRTQPGGSRLVGINSPAARRALDAQDVRETAQAMAKLGISEQIVTQAARGNSKAQAEVANALGNARSKIRDLKNEHADAFIAGNAEKYKSLGKQIDDATGAYNTVKGAIRETTSEQSRADGMFIASKRDLAKYDAALRSLPKRVQTLVQTPGAVDSYADIKRLARQYDLTPKQVRTLIQLSGVDAAAARARAYAAQLAALNGRVATTYLRQVTEHVIAGGGHPIARGATADGGTVTGAPRAPYGDKVIYALAPGEEVISNRHGQADRHRQLLKAINANRMADGGTAGIPGLASGGTAFRVGDTAITVPAADIFTPRSLVIAKALAAASREINALGKDELATARQTRVSRVDILHTMQSIRDTQRELAARHHKGKHKGEHTLTGLDRRTAQAELADYRHQLREERNARRDAIKQAQKDRRQQQADERAQIRQQAIEEQKANRQSMYDSLTGGLDLLSETTSATRAASLVRRQVQDIAEYGQVVAQLRSMGASPLLLQQLQNHATSGDFRSAIRLGKALLAQPGVFKQLNASYSQLGRVSGNVAAFTTDPRFLGGGKFDPTGGAPKVVQVLIDADPTSWTRDIQRVVQFEVEQALAKVS